MKNFANYLDYVVAVICGIAAAVIVARDSDVIVSVAVALALTCALTYIFWNRDHRTRPGDDK